MTATDYGRSIYDLSIDDAPLWRPSLDGLFPEVRAELVPPPPSPLRENLPRDVRVPSHTEGVFDPDTFPVIVEWIVAKVRADGYEALAGSGHSGLVAAAAAAYALRIPMIAVRKNDERPKGDSFRVNAVLPHRPLRYAIVDDFVAGGETCDRIQSEVERAFPLARLSGLLLYQCGYIDMTRNSLKRLSNSARFDGLTIRARLKEIEEADQCPTS